MDRKTNSSLLDNEKAVEFLSRNSEAEFDFSAAGPLNCWEEESVNLPITLRNKVIRATTSVDKDDISYDVRKSRGQNFVLDAAVNFFQRYHVNCTRDNVSLSRSILDSFGELSSILGLGHYGGKKLIMTAPSFGYYVELFNKSKIDFEILPTRAEEGFLPKLNDLEELVVTSGATALLLCSPNNPTGTIMSKECALGIANISKRYNLFVITDGAFMFNYLSEKENFLVAACEDMLERSFTVTNLGKSMMIGNKIGICLTSPQIAKRFEILDGYCTKAQQRVIECAIDDSEENREFFNRNREYFLNNISVVKQKISELNIRFVENMGENRVYVKPLIEDIDATNVYVLDFSGLRGKMRNGKAMQSGLDVAEWLLDDASVGVVPGECFLFSPEEMLVRIVLNQTPTELSKAFDEIIKSTDKIQNPQRAISPSTSASAISASALANELILGIDGAGI